MPVSMKYARVESERRYLVGSLPRGVVRTVEVADRYLVGTRLRLREVRETDGTVVRKLGQKVRLTGDAGRIACTSVYLDDAEWAVLSALPARTLVKRRHHVERDGIHLVVDEHRDGTLVAEIDDGEHPGRHVPAWLDVVRDVTAEEAWTGAGLAGGAPAP